MTISINELRVLLNLWDLGAGQGAVPQSKLLRGSAKGVEKITAYREAMRSLVDRGAIASVTEKKTTKVALTDAGLQDLVSGVLTDDFNFDGALVGCRLANAALRLLRQNSGQAI